MGKEFLVGRMAENILELGLMDSNMGREFIF
jgi:hypothetical protein